MIEGGYEVEAHLGFGFDTYGLSQWRRDGFAASSSWKVFNGFYVADLDRNGDDIPEFTMDASMGAGLGYSARVVRADITGGLEAAVSLDLLDEGEIAGTSDGKIRGREISDRISNPLNLFELSGELVAYVKSRVQIGVDLGFYSIWKTVWERRLAEIPIFQFGIGGRYGSGSVSNGHIANATVYFDANFNGRVDSLEPVTTSDADGRYTLDVDLRTFDRNRNGRIDADEGQLVVFGGTDTSMDQKLRVPFVGPLGGMVTPLTTLHNLAVTAGVPAAEVRGFITEVFELGSFDYLTQDPLRVLQEATSFDDPATREAVNVYLAHIKLHFAWDLISGALQNLLPDDVPNSLAAELELLKGFAASFRERPTAETLKEGLGRAIADAWKRANPDGDPRVAELAARAAEFAASAGLTLTGRLDRIREVCLRSGARPAELLGAINDLKKEAFSLYRAALDGISDGLYRITDPDELVRTVAHRLAEAHGEFVNEPPTAVGFANVLATLPENTSTASRIKVADIVVSDDGSGTNAVVIEGIDAADFEVDGLALFLRAGVILDHESRPSYSVTVRVSDASIPFTTPVTAIFLLTVVNVKEAPTITLPGAGFRATEDTRGPLLFHGAPLGTADSSASARVTVTLKADRGVIRAVSGAGVVVVCSGRVATFTGRIGDINRYFTDPAGRITYRPQANDAGAVRLDVSVAERTVRQTLRSSASSTIFIAAVDDPPTVRAPAGFTVVEDTRRWLSWAAIPRPFADVDSPNLSVTLTVDDGSIDASDAAGIAVTGSATSRTFKGSTSALNDYFRTLGRIGYTPAADSTAPRVLRTTVSDGAASVTTTSKIRVLPVPDAPTILPMTVLEGAIAGRPFEITYSTLLTASGSRDADGTPLTFRLQALQTGVMEKWDGRKWVELRVGGAKTFGFAAPPVLRPGQRLRWVAPADVVGSVPAFTVRASDGGRSSSVSQIVIDLAEPTHT